MCRWVSRQVVRARCMHIQHVCSRDSYFALYPITKTRGGGKRGPPSCISIHMHAGTCMCPRFNVSPIFPSQKHGGGGRAKSHHTSSRPSLVRSPCSLNSLEEKGREQCLSIVRIPFGLRVSFYLSYHLSVSQLKSRRFRGHFLVRQQIAGF